MCKFVVTIKNIPIYNFRPENFNKKSEFGFSTVGQGAEGPGLVHQFLIDNYHFQIFYLKYKDLKSGAYLIGMAYLIFWGGIDNATLRLTGGNYILFSKPGRNAHISAEDIP